MLFEKNFAVDLGSYAKIAPDTSFISSVLPPKEMAERFWQRGKKDSTSFCICINIESVPSIVEDGSEMPDLYPL